MRTPGVRGACRCHRKRLKSTYIRSLDVLRFEENTLSRVRKSTMICDYIYSRSLNFLRSEMNALSRSESRQWSAAVRTGMAGNSTRTNCSLISIESREADLPGIVTAGLVDFRGENGPRVIQTEVATRPGEAPMMQSSPLKCLLLNYLYLQNIERPIM